MSLQEQLAQLQQQMIQEMPKAIFNLQPGDCGYDSHPNYQIEIEPSPKRVRIAFKDVILADSTQSLILRESFHLPVYYLPRADIRMDLMQRIQKHTYCPFKGYASYWTLLVDDRIPENAIWSYEDPFKRVEAIKDYIAFDWYQMNNWYEDGESLFQDELYRTEAGTLRVRQPYATSVYPKLPA